MAVQIVKPADTEFPMIPSIVEGDTEAEDQFEWVSLLCCTYTYYYTDAGTDWEEDTNV